MSKRVCTRQRLAVAHAEIIVRPQRLILHWLVDKEVDVVEMLVTGKFPIPMYEHGTRGAYAQMSRTFIILN